jgi:hypothetical protein
MVYEKKQIFTGNAVIVCYHRYFAIVYYSIHAISINTQTEEDHTGVNRKKVVEHVE